MGLLIRRLFGSETIKMWLINIFSSLIQCVYIFVIQLAIGFVVLLLDFLSSHENLAPEIKSFFGLSRGYSWSDFWPFLEFLLYLVGISNVFLQQFNLHGLIGLQQLIRAWKEDLAGLIAIYGKHDLASLTEIKKYYDFSLKNQIDQLI